MEKSYILCAVVLMSMVLAFPAWAGAKGPGEAAHVENEGQREKLQQKKIRMRQKHRQILELQTRNTICGSMCIGQARHIA